VTVRAGDLGAVKHRGRYAEHERHPSDVSLGGQDVAVRTEEEFEERLRLEVGAAVRAALRAMAETADDREKASAGATGDYATDSAISYAWHDIATDLHIAADRAGTTCVCFEVPVEHHYVYYGATEPGSSMEQNPNCPIHGYDEPPATPVDPDEPPF
jgi:hypothetical protein